MKELVYTQAMVLAGPLEERQAELLRLLCAGAVNALEGRLRDGITAESCKAEFIAAASLYALAGLNEGAQTMQEFKAGDLSVKCGGGDAASRCLRRQADMMIAPYLRDDLVFLGV